MIANRPCCWDVHVMDATTTARRARILARLGEGPCTKADLAQRIPGCARTLHDDLKWIEGTFPGRTRIGHQGKAKTWQFLGTPPTLLPTPIAAFDEDQIAALIAARGVLRISDPGTTPSEGAATAYQGALAQAIQRLISAAGLDDEVASIAPDDLSISRFCVAAEEPTVFPTVLACLRAGRSIRTTYTNNQGATYPLHARPVRLVMISGEWHCFAWALGSDGRGAGRIRQYRLARMAPITPVEVDPPGCPVSGLRAQVDALLRDAFRATGSHEPARRQRVVLAVSPTAWPHIDGRRWGAPVPTPTQDGLPPEWRRIAFVTTGLEECRHWVLSFGAEVRAEHPPALIDWLRDQAQALLNGSTSTLQP
jgi:predicted DNA-binding transcriptional regulator YafY